MKFLLIIFFIYTSVFAQETFYLGTSYGYVSETITMNESVFVTSGQTKLKAGYGDREAYAVELSFDYIEKDKDLFSQTNQKDGDKYGLNIELVKAFDFDIHVNPFFKLGFGAGYFHVDNATKTLHYGTYNAGLGIFIPMNETLDFELGYDYKKISYEDRDKNQATHFKANADTVYLGLNLRF